MSTRIKGNIIQFLCSKCSIENRQIVDCNHCPHDQVEIELPDINPHTQIADSDYVLVKMSGRRCNSLFNCYDELVYIFPAPQQKEDVQIPEKLTGNEYDMPTTCKLMSTINQLIDVVRELKEKYEKAS